MENDSDWQRRSDDWVNASHKSRLRKEKMWEDNKTKGDVQKDKVVNGVLIKK
ncbi:MAG: hypothetical protein COB94_006670 [Gammaproteobacteria bacterium]|nr:hypothetical protein [Gammaproteobacteria bacterium]